MTDKKENDCKSLCVRLQGMQRKGIRLYLEGEEAPPEAIASCCVREDAVYMPDYVTDKEGKLKEVRYDRISLR